jgi:probable HAF family extracellular repeat protein
MRLKLALEIACAFYLVGTAAGQTSYTVVELTTATNMSHSVHRINVVGQSAGSVGSVDGSSTQAFLADQSGHVRKLGWLAGGDYSEAMDVNHAGTVVGYANSATAMRAFLWNRSFQDLGTLPGDVASKAFAINDQSQVVGYSSGPAGVHAFLWSARSGMQSILPAAEWSEAYSISANGGVVGVSTVAGGRQAFYRDAGGTVTNLGTLFGDTQSAALSISSNARYVVGQSSNGSVVRAFRYTQAGGMQLLRDLAAGGSSNTVAFGVNSAGTVVGASVTPIGARATVWTADGSPYDLNDLLSARPDLMLTQALGISENGSILAVGAYMNTASISDMDDQHHAGAVHSFLLIPAK